MEQYKRILQTTINEGYQKGDRTGTGTLSSFCQQERFDIRNGKLPAVTTKYTHLPLAFHELFWMISGDTRLKYLIDNGVNFWNEWVKPGTEVFGEFTPEELKKQVVKLVGGKFVLMFGETAEPFSNVSFDECSATKLPDFWSNYPNIGVDERPNIKYVVTVDHNKWVDKTTEGFILEAATNEEIHFEFDKRLYSIITGKPAKKLIDGSLGEVYGRVWRDIEDTRIIPKVEWSEYEAKGFTFVIDITGNDYSDHKCVVTRRIDQLADVLDMLSKEPTENDKGWNRDSRRAMVNAWNPALIDFQQLPPCHFVYQFWTARMTPIERLEWVESNISDKHSELVSLASWFEISDRMDKLKVPTRWVSCAFTMRSNDTFLGLPMNIAFYSMLTHMIANQFNFATKEVVYTGIDVHIYSNHIQQVYETLQREPFESPTVTFKPFAKGKDIRDITMDDFTISDYKSHPHIAGKVAV